MQSHVTKPGKQIGKPITLVWALRMHMRPILVLRFCDGKQTIVKALTGKFVHGENIST